MRASRALRVAAENTPGVRRRGPHGICDRSTGDVTSFATRAGLPSAMVDDQQDVIDFLSEPSSYGPAIERVDIIETHVSLVFLAADRAYKLKRAVKYPYLDFSTPEHRSPRGIR